MGPVLGNLDPYSGTWTYRSLVWDLYSGTWTRTWEPVLVYVLKSWLNINGTYSTYLVVVIVVIGFEHKGCSKSVRKKFGHTKCLLM